MATSDNPLTILDYGSVLDNLGSGLLIFDDKENLIFDNVAARHILGNNLVLIRSEGWSALELLINANPGIYNNANEVRTKSRRQDGGLRFSMLLAGSYTPCWLATFKGEDDRFYTQIAIESPDWTALNELMSTFRSEARSAINDTNGHASFVQKLLKNPPSGISAIELGERAMGMVNLITTKMYQLQLLLDLLHRLELIRTGELAGAIKKGRQKIDFEDFFEDFLEELTEEALIDPNTDAEEYRSRLILDIDDDLVVMAPRAFLRNILRDVLRNAFMYGEENDSVKLRVSLVSQGRHVEFEVADQGCGIRRKETERVFEPFQRARQPQVMREHGYGLSLYLAKAEVEAMDGRMWFESEEGVGSTFFFKLPAYSPDN